MISAAVILAPLLVEVALTLALLGGAGAIRLLAVFKGAAEREAAFRDALPSPILLRLSEAARAELELPALFYLVVVLSLLTATVSIFLVVLFWIFVATRLAHALIQVTTNDRGRRFVLHWAGFVVLVLTWLVFAVRIALGI